MTEHNKPSWEIPVFSDQKISSQALELARQARIARQVALDAMRSATPTHPVSGEVGTFSRFEYGQRIRPIYRTVTGKEFFVSKEGGEE